jgi:3-deoxy-7-phosphoheptulonate synthase
VRIVRELLLEIADLGVPVATECLEPLSALFIDDLITWGFVGARTSASPPNRHLASLLPFPFGFKNSVEGNLEPAINGVLTASVPHTFLYADESGQLAVRESQGNPHCHIVLRGSTTSPNYSREHVQEALSRLEEAGAPQRILIDCAHGNCQKQPERQIAACMATLDQIEEGNSALFGFMLESYLHAGSQPLLEDTTRLTSGISITDPCLSWAETEKLILSACERTSALFSKK